MCRPSRAVVPVPLPPSRRPAPPYRRVTRSPSAALAVAVVVGVLAGALPGPAAAAGPGVPSASAPAWVRPVPGRVLRPFRAPAHRFGPGHRGVDLATPPGGPVVAAGAGTVTFAGHVAGHAHVVVAHRGGLRTTYAFLDAIDTRTGARVEAGTPVGRAGGDRSAAAGHAGALHFALRVGDTYVDPMRLFGAGIRVRIRSDRGPGPVADPARERRSLREVLRLDAIGEAVRRGAGMVTAADEAARGALVAVGRGVAGAAQRGIAATAPVVDATVRAAPSIRLAAAAWEVLQRLAGALTRWGRCRGVSPPVGPPGSGHRVLAVAGLDSSTDPRTGATMPLAAAALGYEPDEIHWFSYLAPGRAYRRRHTWGGLVRAARRLGAHLRALQRAEPGREVDLVAHSQGGVVVAVYLALLYDPADPALPPLGPVVTLASPHRGVPLAGLVAELRRTPTGRALLAAADRHRPGGVPLARARVLEQLAEESPLLRRVWRAGLPQQVEVTSFAGVGDVAVPAPATAAPGAAVATVDPAGWRDHRGILTDPQVTATVRMVLEGRAPCPSLAVALRAAVIPTFVADVERHLTRVAGGAVRAVDHLRPPAGRRDAGDDDVSGGGDEGEGAQR